MKKSVLELSVEAFDNAISHADDIGMDMKKFAKCGNQWREFENYCEDHQISFDEHGTPIWSILMPY